MHPAFGNSIPLSIVHTFLQMDKLVNICCSGAFSLTFHLFNADILQATQISFVHIDGTILVD